MTSTVILTICILILIAYIFDLTSKHTKIPTVLLLLILGWGVQQITFYLSVPMPNLELLLPLLGTVGLILIVLEGSLGLELNRNKTKVLVSSSASALFATLLLLTSFGLLFSFLSGEGILKCILNGLPLCVISSAIAIPSVANYSSETKEFVVYESSFSDIIGVILFNFFLVNEVINLSSFGSFVFEIIIMLLISLSVSIGLAFLIKRIDHHVKFVPILMMIILIYSLSKIYHLPSLIFILIFGLFLNNLDQLKQFSFIRNLEPEKLDEEVGRFREIVGEITFLVRTMFFLLFGYTIHIEQLIDVTTLVIAALVVTLIFLVRFFQLKVSKTAVLPALFVAPRGLITVLLFLSIPQHKLLPFVNESLILQVVILTVLMLALGSMVLKREKTTFKSE